LIRFQFAWAGGVYTPGEEVGDCGAPRIDAAPFRYGN
jgi:hypothetical protein